MEDRPDSDCVDAQQQNECPHSYRHIQEDTKSKNFFEVFESRREENGSVQPRNKWMALMFGQLVALVATSMNATSYALEYGMHRIFPMFLLFNSYVILSLYLLKIYCSSKKNKNRLSSVAVHGIQSEGDTRCYRFPLTSLELRTPWYYYLCLSFLDIGPNYLTLLAMNRTSFTSATLLGSLTIPSTMLFCRLLLGKEYRRMHYVGVILCMLGGTITILTDKDDISSSSGKISHPDSYGGDVLAVLASLGYGVGDACAEFWSKHVSREEYLGMIGVFGALYTLMASFLCERQAVLEVLASDNEQIIQTAGMILLYIASLVGYYILESLFLMKSDATLLNLSLQTSNFWAILFSIIAFREAPDLQFYISIATVISGVLIYELCGNDDTTLAKGGDRSMNESTPLIGNVRPSHRIFDKPKK
mmetsp:Transcript_74039/g.150319  ORF Transcript_74039/g.150319 Transcript_74039/m.150319 type:complete len:418 (+) Transcript_74039:194-1447(+)